MSDELRDRLGRRIRQVWMEWAAKQPDIGQHPDWLDPWEKLPERIKEVDCNLGMAIWGDAFAEFATQLAKAELYDAEHPADDSEPVTEEWLRSVGFVHSIKSVLEIGPPGLKLSVSMPDRYWVVDCMPLLRKHETHGDVRRLCAAMGITLKEGWK